MRMTWMVLAIMASAAVLSAGTIFSENFEGAIPNAPVSVGSAIAGTQFSLLSGTIDINGTGWYPELCSSPASGVCIDTTGWANQRGTISTTNLISFAPGNYYLSFDLEGWSSLGNNETATVQVDLGSLIVAQQYVRTGSSNPYSTVIISFTVATATSANLTFTDLNNGSATSGYAGAILDNISIQTGSPAPEPGSLVLLGLGLAGLPFLRKKLSRS